MIIFRTNTASPLGCVFCPVRVDISHNYISTSLTTSLLGVTDRHHHHICVWNRRRDWCDWRRSSVPVVVQQEVSASLSLSLSLSLLELIISGCIFVLRSTRLDFYLQEGVDAHASWDLRTPRNRSHYVSRQRACRQVRTACGFRVPL